VLLVTLRRAPVGLPGAGPQASQSGDDGVVAETLGRRLRVKLGRAFRLVVSADRWQ